MIVVSLSSVRTLEPAFSGAGIEYYFLHIDRWADLPGGLRKIRSLVRRLSKSTAPPLLIHAHMFHACMIGCALRVLSPRVPLVFSLHNRHVEKMRRRILLWLCRPLRNVDVIFPGTGRNWYQKRRCFAIGIGIPVHRYRGLAARETGEAVFTCLFLGRLELQKDPLSLVDLAVRLRSQHRFRIQVAGEGSLLGLLTERIAEEGLQDCFELLGFVAEPAPLLAQAHCLLLPSRWEGMPLALLEAAAAGVPVIATPVGNIPSFANVSNAFIGEIAAFPSLLNAVMNNYPEALARAEKLREWVSTHYGMERVAQRYYDLYREYAGDNPP